VSGSQFNVHGGPDRATTTQMGGHRAPEVPAQQDARYWAGGEPPVGPGAGGTLSCSDQRPHCLPAKVGAKSKSMLGLLTKKTMGGLNAAND